MGVARRFGVLFQSAFVAHFLLTLLVEKAGTRSSSDRIELPSLPSSLTSAFLFGHIFAPFGSRNAPEGPPISASGCRSSVWTTF